VKALPLYCGNCATLLRVPIGGPETAAACPSCGAPIEARVFPAAFHQEQGRPAEPVVAEGEAGCFYHSDKRAQTHCASCGRFLCALCDVEFEGQHRCPLCIEAGIKQGAMPHLRNSITPYDSLALAVAVLPPATIIGIYFLIFTAPAALILAIYGWNKPPGMLTWRRGRLVLAMLIAVAEIVAVVGFIVSLAMGAFK
jgi:hypothetical protein